MLPGSRLLCSLFLQLCRSMNGALKVGLPFSDKKIIPRNTEQDGTDSSSVGIPPVSRKRKTSEFRFEPFSEEKKFGIPYRIIFGREKLWKKTTFVRCFVNTYIPTHIRTPPHIYIHPTHIHTSPNTYVHPLTHTVHTSPHTYIHLHTHMYIHPTHIHTYIHTYIHTDRHTYVHTYIHTYTQKSANSRFFLSLSALSLFFLSSSDYFAEFGSVPFRVTEWTLPKYSESHGMSTLFRGITKTVPSLFRGIFSERNFDGNPT